MPVHAFVICTICGTVCKNTHQVLLIQAESIAVYSTVIILFRKQTDYYLLLKVNTICHLHL